MENRNRIFGLDILRFVAIVFVLMDHTYKYIEPKNFKYQVNIYFGFLGVELFFILSGFLIGSILIKTYNKSNKIEFYQIKFFWIRRWFRTLPNYYLMLSVYLTADYLKHSNFLLLNIKYFSYFIFLQNFVTIHPHFFATAWSLSIEEWFYITFPITLLFIQKFRQKSNSKLILWSVFIFVVVCLFLRIILAISINPFWDVGFRKVMPLRLDAIAIGVLFAYFKIQYINKWIENRNHSLFIGIISIALLLFAFFQGNSFDDKANFFLKTIFFTLISISIGLILPYFDSIKNSNNRFWGKIITHISLISYSMYLTHWLLIKIIDTPYFNQMYGAAKFFVIWLTTIIIASFQYKYFEKPMTSLREKFTN